jgi:UDP-4-amino-4,6-dideoxy-N-acetyl-beta-L-altrosamine transaminase
MISYGRQDINQADIDTVLEVMQSDFLTQGPMVPRFEQAMAQRCKAKHAVALNSATSALHVACLALRLGTGDSLWTVSNTFVASANCGLYCGADIDFIDIDSDTWNLSVSALREKLVMAKHQGKLPKIVIPVHFSGQPTEQEAIWDLAKEYGFKIIEDASHAIGASRNGEPVGSCKWSHITVFSFHPVKIITTGEGGMAMTNDDELARNMALLRSHGITRDTEYMKNKPSGSWYYEQIELGFNYRMTDIQAALGLSQLTRLDEFIERRNFLAQRYNQFLETLPVRCPTILAENRSSFHLYVVRLKTDQLNNSHRYIFSNLRDNGIGVNLHYMPVHLQPYYRELGFKPGLCKEAELYSGEAISLPLYPTLTEQEQDKVIDSLSLVLK